MQQPLSGQPGAAVSAEGLPEVGQCHWLQIRLQGSGGCHGLRQMQPRIPLVTQTQPKNND